MSIHFHETKDTAYFSSTGGEDCLLWSYYLFFSALDHAWLDRATVQHPKCLSFLSGCPGPLSGCLLSGPFCRDVGLINLSTEPSQSIGQMNSVPITTSTIRTREGLLSCVLRTQCVGSEHQVSPGKQMILPLYVSTCGKTHACRLS